MLFDTDVFIWALRRNRKAARVLEAAELRAVSVVTYMELLQGARDRVELQSVQAFLLDLAVATLPLTENIGHRAAIYVEQHALKSGVRLADALVAATAVEGGLVLCSANRKHYRPIAELELKVFRP